MCAYQNTKENLTTHKLAPKKQFGQNFLVNRSTAERIASFGDFTLSDTAVEVGVGLGALTKPLSKIAGSVIGIEIDSGIIRFHEQEKDLENNVQLIHRDILKTDFNELFVLCGGKKLKIITNLPYSISNPFLFKLIENRHLVDFAIVMLQKEVADRITAPVGSKDYGIPTVLLGATAKTTKLLTLKPAEFHPRPKIDSVVVKVDFNLPHLLLDETQAKVFAAVVRAAFSQRRKTVHNTLSSSLSFPGLLPEAKNEKKDFLKQVLERLAISTSARAETLSMDDFFTITKYLIECEGSI